MSVRRIVVERKKCVERKELFSIYVLTFYIIILTVQENYFQICIYICIYITTKFLGILAKSFYVLYSLFVRTFAA